MQETESVENSVQKQIDTLKELQSVDIELREIERGLQKYPGEVSVFKDEIQTVKESLTERKLRIEESDKSKSLLERKLSEKKDYVEKTEERLLRIKTHKEYEALQKELTDAKRDCIEIEDNILKVMEGFEKLNSESEELANSLKEKEEKYGPKISEFENIIKELEIKHAPRRKEKDSIAGLLNPEVLPLYTKISARTPIFLSLARAEMCTNCNMNIPPQMFNEVLTKTKIIQCPSCNRILYCED